MFKKRWTLWDDASGESGAPAPATPDTAPVEEGGDEVALEDSSINWSDYDKELDVIDYEGDEEVVEGAEGEEPEAPEPAPERPAEKPAEPPPPAKPVEQPPAVQPPPVTQTPAEVPPPQAPAVDDSAGSMTPEAYQGWRTGRLGELEKHYAFDEESSAALLTEPENVLPKLAAQVHMEVLENAMRAMQAMVPVLIQQVRQHDEVQTAAKGLFARINPDLADPKYDDAIIQLGMTYRRMNQTAGPEEASRAIGNLVRAAMGMQAPGPAPATQGQVVPPQTAAPFVPARGGGGGQRAPVSSNPFEALANEFLEDDMR